LDLALDVDAFISAATPTESLDVQTSDGYALWLFARAVSAYRAAMLLLNASFGDEAMELARALFTDGLRLLELERLGSRRHSVLLGWKLKSIADSEHLMEEAVRVGLETDPKPVLDRLAQERASVLGYATRRGFEPPSPQDLPTEKTLAARFGCMEDYWNFRYAHHFVHGTPVAVNSRLRRAPDGTHLFDMRASGASLAEGTTLFLSRYVLLAFSGLLGILESEKPPELDALLQRIEELGSGGPTAQERSR
jgi:hypothetical protein